MIACWFVLSVTLLLVNLPMIVSWIQLIPKLILPECSILPTCSIIVYLPYIYTCNVFEGSLEVKLDNMDRWKAEQGRGREKRKIRRKKSRRERVRRKKMQMREKVGKSRNTVFFQWFGAPEGRKVGSLKRRVRSQLASTPLWCEAHLQV